MKFQLLNIICVRKNAYELTFNFSGDDIVIEFLVDDTNPSLKKVDYQVSDEEKELINIPEFHLVNRDFWNFVNGGEINFPIEY